MQYQTTCMQLNAFSRLLLLGFFFLVSCSSGTLLAQYYCRYLNEISLPGGRNMLHYSEAQCEILCQLHLISSSLAFKENPK